MSDAAKPNDELITVRMPVWAFRGIMNGIEKWAGDQWSTFEITEPLEFVEVPPSWRIVEEDGQRYLLGSDDA